MKAQHPMEENFAEWDAERKRRRWDYWSALRRMRNEYLEEQEGHLDLTARPTRHYWAEQKYGLKMGLDGQGGYTEHYEVVDVRKFLIFQLKFWQ